VTWKVTDTKVADHQFQYQFDGRPRFKPADPFIAVLSGTHTAAVDGNGDPVEGFGSGSFTIDWDARAKLPLANPREVGTASYTYARMPGVETSVAAQFHQVMDDQGRRVDVNYAFTHQPGAGGTMDFTDEAPASKGMPAGHWAFRSRWLAGGAGRADARATIAGVAAPATASECWSASFASTFLVRSWDAAAGYGAGATDCAFPAADYSKL
jgi:hypothetical protein